MRIAGFAAFLALAAGTSIAFSQVVINEFVQNPPGSGSNDDLNEYIELYGKPGMSLDGYAIAILAGGQDDGDDIPGPLTAGDPGDEIPEIDEAFTLDGLSIGSNGFLVLYSTTSGGASNIPAILPGATTRRSYSASHIPTTDTAGKVKNDGSISVVLVRKRPDHSMSGSTSVYGPAYAWRKEPNFDVDFNSRVDFGYETSLPGVLPPSQSGALALEPYQMVDDLAYSNEGGKEYVRSNEQRISDSPGFNPDQCSRVFFFGTNPLRGHRLNDLSVMVDTDMADEEWIYGEGLSPATSRELNPALAGGPTDQNPATKYDSSGNPDPQGFFLLDDINLTGFNLTPGDFNDVDSTGVGGINITQYRFIEGDINFSGKWDYHDSNLAATLLGATLDDQEMKIDDRNTASTSDDVVYTGWKWEGRAFQTLLALMCMDPADGPGGSNAAEVTQSDIDAAFRCPSDYDSNGFPNGDDFDAFVADFEQGLIAADWDANGFVNGDDFDGFVLAFEAGC